MKRPILVAASVFLCCAAHAGSPLSDSWRVGGGLGSSQVDGTAHTTITAFAGADTLQRERVRGGIEAGMIDTGDSGADGGWVSGIVSFGMGPDVNILARAGVDFGGDAGWLLGVGVGYFIERNMEVRMEFAEREHSAGVQFNLAYYLNRGAYP